MPKPHTKKIGSPIHPGYHGITVRLTDAEYAAVQADIAVIALAGGPASTPNAYCRHGALSYARLRRMETMLREAAQDHEENVEASALALRILEAGR